MKHTQVSHSPPPKTRRDLALLAGLAGAALALGLFTPLFTYAFGWAQRLGVLEALAGMLAAVALGAVMRLWRRTPPSRSAPEASPSFAPVSSFPTRSPYPVLDVDGSGAVVEANLAVRHCFPDLEARGTAHPVLRDVWELAEGAGLREVQVGAGFYEERAVPLPEQGRLRLYLRDVTRRRMAHEALRKSEEKFEHVFRAAPLALSLHRLSDGRFIDVNEQFLRLLGYRGRDQVVGKTDLELDLWAAPGNRARILRLLAQDDRAAHRYEAQLLTHDGDVRDVIASVVVMEVEGEACVLSALLDVTEHREAEAGLGVLKAFYENTLRELPIEVAVLDDEARFIYLNPAALPDEALRLWLLGKTSVDFAHARGLDPAPYQTRHAWLLDVIASKQMGRLEETLTTRAGERRHLLRVAMPVLDDDERVIYVVGYGLDVTERKTFERELLQAKSAAEEMARLKSSFVANMSHEVRTPLTAILGFATILGEELGGEQREIAEIIKQSGERLLETLNSVLDLARLEARALNIDPRALNLNDELAVAVRLFKPLAEQKNLNLHLRVPEVPVRAPLDRAYLHRILSNLLSNAIKFTDVGEVRVSLQTHGSIMQIAVRDTGIGIDAAFLPYLFEEFKQESTGLARTHTGSGLGLAITRHLVAQMEGQIEVESTKGLGTTITVTLPLRAPELHAARPSDQLNLFADAPVTITSKV